MAEVPNGRQRNGSGVGSGLNRRGSGTGSGPVGNSGGYSGRGGNSGRGSSSGSGSSGSGGNRGILGNILGGLTGGSGSSGSSGGSGGGNSGGGLSSILNGKTIIALIVAVVLFLIIAKCSGLFDKINLQNISSLLPINTDTSYVSNLTETAASSSGWSRSANTGVLDTSVASGSRAKRTKILGNGNDTVTVMVYMCGTDLESKNGMASADLAEMTKATLSGNVNVIVLTGGCTGWKQSFISNTTNQIYKVINGGLTPLEKDFGNNSMTKPSTLTSFIKYCAANYPANRYELIFWDHGGGSISGYGYDQRFTSSGGMTLSGINTALKDAGTKFDFIGFDTCLMGTCENALMLSSYADYMIGSEETEPGSGWYYTNWLTKLSSDTSMPTVEVGKIIIDDFTSECARKYSSAKTTLAIVDLAELETTVPAALSDFARSTTAMINSDSFGSVSDARSSTREYSSNKIDQVDLVHLADNIGTAESKALAKAILGAVKYNRVSSAMVNSYGLSIYFPFSKLSTVDKAVSTYQAIGMDNEYTKCIKQFASMETAGQVSSGGSSNSIFNSILGNFTGNGSDASASSDIISSLLGSFLGGSGRSVTGLDRSNIGYMSGFDVDSASKLLTGKIFDSSKLTWLDYNGKKVIGLTDGQWKLVSRLELNVFYDDGEGYLDLGLDNIFSFKDGYLLGEYDGMWVTINGQFVAYYYIDTVISGSTRIDHGRVPVLLNGDRAELLLSFTNGIGKVDGVRYVYDGSETQTVAKDTDMEMLGLKNGDKIDFLCDYYTYDNEFIDSFKIGEQMSYAGDLIVEDKYLPDNAKDACAVYRFTDIYGEIYWSEVIG